MSEPTNADLQKSFDEHTVDDHKFQDEQRKFNVEQGVFKAETEGSLADLHSKVGGLATKEDIDSLKEDLKGYLIGGNIFKYAFNNGGKITGLFSLIVIVYLIIKYGFLGIVVFFIHSFPSLPK